MKKVIVCVLVLILCLTAFFACDPVEPTTDYTAALAAAKSTVKNMYDSQSKVTSVDYTLWSQVVGSGVTFDITWTVSITTEGVAADAIKATKGDDAWTVDVPEQCAYVIDYTITATITNGDYSDTISFERQVPKFEVATWEEYKATADETGSSAGDDSPTLQVLGYIVGVNADPGSSSKVSLWLEDATGHGYYAYAPTVDAELSAVLNGDGTADEKRAAINARFPLGTEVIITGKPILYSGAYEFAKGCTYEFTGRTATDAGVTLDYNDRTEAFANAANNDALIQYQSTLATLKNVTMGEIDGYNYHFTVGEKDYICYMNIYLMDSVVNAEVAAKWVVGGKANLTGLINVYSNKYQLYPNGVNSIEIVQEDLTDAEKVARALDTISLEEKYDATFELPTSTWATLTWSVKSGEGVVVDGANAVVTQGKEDLTVVLTATATSGEVSDSKDFTITVPAPKATFILNALNAGNALADKATTEDSYIIIGTVSSIKDAYSEQYKNVSFYVSDGTNEILIFRYNLEDAATIAVGQQVAFAAPIKKYGSDIEAVATFVPLTLTSAADATAAATAGSTDDVSVYGRISEIKDKDAYSSSFNNISFTITDGTGSFYCYRVVGGKDLAVGDYVLVEGTLGAYKGAGQLAQGGTYNKTGIYVAPVVRDPLETEFTTTDYATLAGTVSADNKNSTDAYYAIGWIKSIGNATFGNMTIEDEEGNTLYVYGVYGFDGNVQFGKLPVKPEVGDVVVLHGKMNYYNSAQMKNANLVQHGTDVCALTADYAWAQLAVEKSYDANFTLPAVKSEGATVTWAVKSGDAIVLDGANATVTRGAEDATVVLTASLVIDDAAAVTKDFTVTVPAALAAGVTQTTYTFKDYTAGAQYATEEVHQLDDVVKVTVTDGHFTTQIRLYDSTGENGHDSIAIVSSTKAIDKISLNAGYEVATLNVYGSTDGTNWVLIQELATTSDYADHELDVTGLGYTYLKLDAVGAQIRVASMTLTFAAEA